MESKFKGLADIALKEAKRRGCTYADIRFTRATNSGVNANGGNPVPGAEDVGQLRRRRRSRRRPRRRGGSAAADGGGGGGGRGAAGAPARPASACA